MTNWFLYLLECADGSLYAGIATDVAARYAAHAAGKGARYTRSRPPRRLLGWMAYPDRASASRAEYALKQLRPAVKRLFATTMQQGDPPMTVARKSSRSQPRVPAAEVGAASDSDESRLAGTVTLASDAVLPISSRVAIPFGEISMQAIRAQGAGGQNVNKVSSAIHLRFDIHRSSLPELYKQRLLALQDQRISQDGVIVIKAQTQRSQERNRVEALQRLQQLVRGVMVKAPPRKPTRVPLATKRQRLADKRQRAEIKARRGKLRDA